MRCLRTTALLVVVGLPACSFDSGVRSDGPPGRIDSRPGEIDGPPGQIDANDIDAPPGTPDATPNVAHLLISEVRTGNPEEFVEIYNPNNAAVSLAGYYLTDIPVYWQLPGHVAGNLSIVPENADFMVQFPAGDTIPGHGVIVVAVSGTGFEVSFADPDYTIAVPVSGATPMVVAPGEPGLGGAVTLTNVGEVVILFHWDGASDLVRDVDIVLAGNAPDPGNSLAEKAPVDGPDGNANPTAYLADAMTLEDMESDTTDQAGTPQSYKRISGESGNEDATGGNGVAGHDETSEQLRTTWDSRANGNSYTLATPGTVPF